MKWRDKSRMSAIHFILSFSILFVAWLYFCFGLFMKIQETGHESVLIVLSLYSFPLILRLELEQTCIIMYKHHNAKEQIWKTKKWNDFSSFSHTLSCLHTWFSWISDFNVKSSKLHRCWKFFVINITVAKILVIIFRHQLRWRLCPRTFYFNNIQILS